MNDILIVKELIKKRDSLRRTKQFKQADEIRNQIQKLGYEINDDNKGNTKVNTLINSKHEQFLLLFGSGEVSSVGRHVFEEVLKQIGKKSISIAIISTPAGFQPNVVQVHEEISAFFINHLKNFHPQVSIIYANNKTAANKQEVINQLDGADLLFLGPGSPTYTVAHLVDTKIINKIKSLVKNGASIALSSAAVLAFSKYTLPVYEIYKVGTDLYWEDGLDFLSLLGLNETYIPHLNNYEGGEKLDTSYCFMGKKRFEKLRSLLPKGTTISGIEEQTALVYNLSTKEKIVLGKGLVHPL